MPERHSSGKLSPEVPPGESGGAARPGSMLGVSNSASPRATPEQQKLRRRTEMDRTERFYRMLKLLESRRVVSRDAFMDDMSVSRATFKRDLEYMVERLRAPILYDRSLGGYRLDNPPGAPRFELPGVWFSASEAHALLTRTSARSAATGAPQALHRCLGRAYPGVARHRRSQCR